MWTRGAGVQPDGVMRGMLNRGKNGSRTGCFGAVVVDAVRSRLTVFDEVVSARKIPLGKLYGEFSILGWGGGSRTLLGFASGARATTDVASAARSDCPDTPLGRLVSDVEKSAFDSELSLSLMAMI